MDTLIYDENFWKKKCPKVDCKGKGCDCGLHFISIAAALGDDSPSSPVAPKNGNYCNTLVKYEANGNLYLYSKDGGVVPVTSGLSQSVLGRIAALEAGAVAEAEARANADTALNTAITDEATARQNADTALNTALDIVNDAIFDEEIVWDNVPITLESGKFWTMSGATSNYANAKRSTNAVPVSPGDKLRITTRIGTNICGVVYFNDLPFSQSTFVGYDLYDIPAGSTVRTYTDEEVTVPNGAAYVVVQGRLTETTPVGIKKQEQERISKIETLDDEVDGYISSNDFEVENLERRATNAENSNPFAWSAFDKSYFVFIHDDTNAYLETYAGVFHEKGAPMGAATIPANITNTHLATLQQMVADGGEVLGHYSGSPTESSTDAVWMACTGDVKKALEAYGFDVHGLIKADSTASSTNKGQKYCQRYYDYADNHLGKTTQYNLPRTLMLRYDSLAAFKARIDALENVNGIHAFGFHGGRQDEAWITAEAFAEIIDYINAKSNCEITTYRYLWETFGSSVLAEKIKVLEGS